MHNKTRIDLAVIQSLKENILEIAEEYSNFTLNDMDKSLRTRQNICIKSSDMDSSYEVPISLFPLSRIRKTLDKLVKESRLKVHEGTGNRPSVYFFIHRIPEHLSDVNEIKRQLQLATERINVLEEKMKAIEAELVNWVLKQ